MGVVYFLRMLGKDLRTVITEYGGIYEIYITNCIYNAACLLCG